MQLLLINTMTPSNAGVFSEYVLPNISPLVTDVDLLVRCTYAQCLAPLADVGSRLLELSRGMLSDVDAAPVSSSSKTSSAAALAAKETNEETSYDAALATLQSAIRDQAVALLVDPSTHVKRALLRGLAPLCVFLGRAQTADVLLSHSITYLNDPDWALRAAFFEACVGLAACVGGKSVEQYILPLMGQALTGVLFI
jgi:phosphoinositide-3-kinase regulatory subunit 4